MTHLWRKVRRWLSDMGLVRAPIGYCRMCGSLLYGQSIGEHFDTCVEFKRKMYRIMLDV